MKDVRNEEVSSENTWQILMWKSDQNIIGKSRCIDVAIVLHAEPGGT